MNVPHPYGSHGNNGASDAASNGLCRTSGAILLVAVSFSVCEELCRKIETGDHAKSSRQ